MVTDYIKECGYKYDRLENHIYLIIGNENIIIDNGEHYQASAITPFTYTVVDGFNISYTENDSLDERWKFQKTLRISVNGKIDYQSYSGDIYAVIETYDKTKYLVNPDFPLKLTYRYDLSKETNQTEITLQTLSNMPTLEFVGGELENVSQCKPYSLNGIKSLSLIEKDYAVYDSINNVLKSTGEFKKIDYLKDTCSLSESFDGQKVTSTIKFDIAFDGYKTDWQYKLLEFKDNLYKAVIKAEDNWKYYVGFHTGLIPTYQIDSNGREANNTIGIELKEVSSLGCFKSFDAEEQMDSATTYEYINLLGSHKTYICNGCGKAEIMVQAEIDSFGNQTGNYKLQEDVYDGLFVNPDEWYEEKFGWIRQYNIVGTFQSDYPNGFFPTMECACYVPTTKCSLSTDMPQNMIFEGSGTTGYSFNASCDWTITDVPSAITITPMSGNADQTYTLTIDNESEDEIDEIFKIKCCNSIYNYNVNVRKSIECIEEQYKYINCEAQTVQFQINNDCGAEIISGSAGLLYYIQNDIVYVNVPSNDSNATKQYYLYIICCGDNVTLQIAQNPPSKVWLQDGYVCSGGSKYIKESLYTGTTIYNVVKTPEFRLGELIEANSPYCSSISKWEMVGYTCENGDKYELYQRFLSYDDGETWNPTPETRLGNFVESSSSFCEQTVEYDWVLTDEWTCIN